MMDSFFLLSGEQAVSAASQMWRRRKEICKKEQMSVIILGFLQWLWAIFTAKITALTSQVRLKSERRTGL